MDTSLENKILNQHNHKIWTTNDGKWCTYVDEPENQDNRRFIRRTTREDLLKCLEEYYDNGGHYIKKKTKLEQSLLDKYKKDFSLYREINIWHIKSGLYQISPNGDIYSVKKHDWMAEPIYGEVGRYKGQKTVLLRVDNDSKSHRFYVSRLTMAMFNGLPPADMKDPTVDHIDGDSLNNYYENLRWVEREDNTTLRFSRGIGEENGRAILTQNDVVHICNLLIKKKATISEIAKMYNVSEGAINSIYNKQNWKHITCFFEFER